MDIRKFMSPVKRAPAITVTTNTTTNQSSLQQRILDRADLITKEATQLKDLAHASQALSMTTDVDADSQEATETTTEVSNAHDDSEEEEDNEEVELSEEQKEAISLALSGQNIFISGPGGVGKSELIRQFRELLPGTLVTAPTGIAANSISGVTLHYALGLTPSTNTLDQYRKWIHTRPKIKQRVKKFLSSVKTLIIDEISMTHGDLFQLMFDIIADFFRVENPFDVRDAGDKRIQIIVVGDMYQISPIETPDERERRVGPKYAFETDAWEMINFRPVILHKCFRQNDEDLYQALNDIRVGNFSMRARKMLQRASSNVLSSDAVRLVGLNRTKNDENDREIAKLEAEEKTFTATDTGEVSLLASCIAPQIVRLKQHARVMLIRNMPEHRLYNGSLGYVVDFDAVTGNPLVCFDGKAKGIQVELNSWEIFGTTTSRKDPPPILAARRQIPLIPAYVLTYHKSQGLSIPKLVVNVQNIFSYGQLYVGLSRCRSLDGLQIIGNVTPQKIRVDPRVVEFYDRIEQEIKQRRDAAKD